MTVPVSLNLPDAVYRRLYARSEKDGVKVAARLEKAARRLAGELTEFEAWLVTRDPAVVAEERVVLPERVIRHREFDNETKKLLALLRANERKPA